MATREEIREGIIDFFAPPEAITKGNEQAQQNIAQVIDELLKYLHSQGVVLKVERELPEEGLYFPGDFRHPNWLTKQEMQSIMDLAVEPLIEVKEPIAEPEPEPSPKCTACEGRGFIEHEHGLIQVECEVCKGTVEVQDVLTLEVLEKALGTHPELRPKSMVYIEALNDSSSGTGQPDKSPRSEHPSKPQFKPKRKTKAKASKRSS